MYNYVRSPMCIKCCLMVLGDEKFGFKELFLFMQSFPGQLYTFKYDYVYMYLVRAI